MAEAIKTWKEITYTLLGALVLTFGGVHFGFTLIPICYPVVEIALNCLAFLGLIAAVISSIKKSFFYFLIHVITIVIKLGFYITFINYLGLAEQNLTYQSMTKELKTLIEADIPLSPNKIPEAQEVFILAGKQMASRLYLAVYILAVSLGISLLAMFLCFSWKCCRIVRYGRRAVREKETKVYGMSSPTPVAEMSPSAPFFDHN